MVFNNWKYVMRTMIAEDMIMFKPSQTSRAMMLAADIAREEGLSGRPLWGRVAEIMGTTEEQQQKIEKQALAEGFSGIELQHRIDELTERQRPVEEVQLPSIDYAKRATFNYQSEGLAGFLGAKVREAGSRYPLLIRPIIPFTNIVANVTNTSIDYTPWGFVRAIKGVRQISGKQRMIIGHERAQLQAKAFLGTATMITAFLLDLIHDDDDEEKKWFAIYASGPGGTKGNQLRELGWKPWSVKIGKHYIDYRLTPFAIPFAIIGCIRDSQRWRKIDEKSLWTSIAFSTVRSLSVILDMSFLSGMNRFMQLINVQSPDQAARRGREFLVGSAVNVAIPNLLRQIDKTFDPIMRDNDTMIEAILRDVPIVSRGVKPRLNVLGEPIPQTTGPISLVISPAKSGPLWQMIIKNEAWISVPDKVQHIGKRLMTEDEYYNFIKYRGEALRERIEKNMTMLEGLNKERFNKVIDRFTADAARLAKRRIRLESKEFQK